MEKNYSNNEEQTYYNNIRPHGVPSGSFIPSHGYYQYRPTFFGPGQWMNPYQFPAWAYNRPGVFPGGIFPWLVLGSMFWPRDDMMEYYDF